MKKTPQYKYYVAFLQKKSRRRISEGKLYKISRLGFGKSDGVGLANDGLMREFWSKKIVTDTRGWRINGGRINEVSL